VGEVLLMNSRR